MVFDRRKKESYSDKKFDEALAELFFTNRVGVREFARKSNVNYSYLSKLKTGKIPPPSNDIIEKIAQGFGLSADYFLEYRLSKIYQHLIADQNLTNTLYYMYQQPLKNQERMKDNFIKRR